MSYGAFPPPSFFMGDDMMKHEIVESPSVGLMPNIREKQRRFSLVFNFACKADGRVLCWARAKARAIYVCI